MKALVIFLSALAFTSASQDTSTPTNGSYQKGTIIVAGDTLSGNIKLQLEDDNVVLKNDAHYQLITAREVKVHTTDASFVGLEVRDRWRLFELMFSGENGTMIVFRENFKFKPTDPTIIGPIFIYQKGQFQEIKKDKEVLDVFGDDENWMSWHIKAENLDLTSKEDLIKVFKYYKTEKL